MDPYRCNCLSLILLRPTIPGISSPSATHTFTSHTVYLSTEREHATLHTSATHTFRDNSMYRRGNLAPERRILCRDTHLSRQFHVSRKNLGQKLYFSLRDTHFLSRFVVSQAESGVRTAISLRDTHFSRQLHVSQRESGT